MENQVLEEELESAVLKHKESTLLHSVARHGGG
jgi:hypothetical protein